LEYDPEGCTLRSKGLVPVQASGNLVVHIYRDDKIILRRFELRVTKKPVNLRDDEDIAVFFPFESLKSPSGSILLHEPLKGSPSGTPPIGTPSSGTPPLKALKIEEKKDELREAQAALFNVNSQSGWLLINYVGPNVVHFAAGGEGDVDEIKQHLQDDQIQYGLIRLGNIQEKGTLKVTLRDVFVTWIGPSVGIIEKGKKSSFLGDVQAYLQPFHADLTVLNKRNFNRDNALDRSNPLSGSHVID